MAYTREELISAIHEAGVNKGDTILVHTGLSSLRDFPKGVKSQDELSQFCIDSLMDAVGEEGTIFVPAFSYSFGMDEVFDKENTPTRNIGDFPEYFRKLNNVERSSDPFLSFSAIGPRAKDLFDNCDHTSLGKNSFFERFVNSGGKLVGIGVGFRWLTIRYHFCEIAQVPFRYEKFFPGERIIDGEQEYTEWIYSVAPYAEDVDEISRKLGYIVEDELNNSDKAKRASVGRGYVSCIKGDVYRDYLLEKLRENPWISSSRIKTSDEIISAEIKRTGEKIYDIKLENGSVRELAEQLLRIPRYLISDGYDASLKAISDFYNLQITGYYTGTEALNWIVPERYICKKVLIKSEDGEELLSSDSTPQIIIPYSRSFHGMVNDSELKNHLYVVASEDRDILGDVIPYKSKCYSRRGWEISCSQQQLSLLNKDKYEVIIDSDYSYDKAKIATWRVAGKSKKTIVFVTHLDGAYQFNWGLSGVIAGIKVFETISRGQGLNYSYKLLITPKDIGLACWMGENGEKEEIIGIVNLDMLAVADGEYSLLKSLYGGTAFEKETCNIVEDILEKVNIRDYSDLLYYGFDDERVAKKKRYNYFKWSDIEIPILSFFMMERNCKLQNPYTKYHTNKDVYDEQNESILNESIRILEEYIKKIDNKRF